tara:strand:+ start:283 stop:1146 length:864 start_codon:yes stop_codon:yes gene_type:complete
MSLTIVIVTFKSQHLISNLIKSIPEEFNILIVENSKDLELKSFLESSYKNVKVYIPEENLGYARGVNYGVRKASTKYVLCLVADVIFEKQTFFLLEKIIKKFDFAIVAPTFKDEKIYKNYVMMENSNLKTFEVDNFQLIQVKEVDGAAFVINKDKFKDNVMDDRIFMYFENTDMCLNTLRRGEKIFAILNLKFDHLGLQSSEEKYLSEIRKNRNWHYCWSKFYYYKKNYNYFYALSKITPNFFRAAKILFKSLIRRDAKMYQNSKAELLGIINSILNKKSSYRPKIS